MPRSETLEGSESGGNTLYDIIDANKETYSLPPWPTLLCDRVDIDATPVPLRARGDRDHISCFMIKRPLREEQSLQFVFRISRVVKVEMYLLLHTW